MGPEDPLLSSITWLLIGHLRSSPYGPLHSVGHDMAGDFPQNKYSEEREREGYGSYNEFMT